MAKLLPMQIPKPLWTLSAALTATLLFVDSSFHQQLAADNLEQALRTQLNQTMELSSKKSGQFDARVREFLLPNHGEWFSLHFGESEGATLAAQYEIRAVQAFNDRIDSARKIRRTQFAVERIGRDKERGGLDWPILDALQRDTPVYLASTVDPRGLDPYVFGYFVEVDGAFRYIPYEVFSWLSSLALRIRVGGEVQKRQLINPILPAYPMEARLEGKQAKVLLQVIIATDGTIKELTVISGPKVFADAAVEAVRKWRYHPTLLNGRPVEVVTTVEVVFKPN